jgi:hypothetical protein
MASKICNCRTSKFCVLDLERNKDVVFTEPKTSSNMASSAKAVAEVKAAVPAPKAAGLPQESCDVEALILSTLAKEGSTTSISNLHFIFCCEGVIEDSWDLACSNNIDHQVIIGNMKSLLADAYVNDIGKSVEIWLLTPEGQTVMAQGSPEYQVTLQLPCDEHA